MNESFEDFHYTLNEEDICNHCYISNLQVLMNELLRVDATDTEKMFDILLEIKFEIEMYCNVALNIDDYIDLLMVQMGPSFKDVTEEGMDAIRRRLKEKENEKHLGTYQNTDTMSDYYEYYDEHMEQHVCPRSRHKRKEVEEVPATLTCGVVMCLAGIFFMVLPIPIGKDLGIRLLFSGFGMASGSVCNRIDENRKEEKEQKKRNKF